MKFLLIRHGETDWNMQKRIQGGTDIPLNENGLAQAAELAKTLAARRFPVCALYTSPLLRAMQTAHAAADVLGLSCQSINALREINFGLWEGLCWDEVEQRFPQEFEAWRKNRRYGHPPEGESYQDLLERFLPVLQKIARETPQEAGDVIIVTHSACIMSLLSLLNNTPFHEMVKRYKFSNTSIAEIEAKQILSQALSVVC